MREVRRLVGIVTMYGLTNYGNRLQDYAIHYLLRQRGFVPRTFILRRRYILGALAEWMRHAIKYLDRRSVDARRYRNFHRFNRQIAHANFLSNAHLERTRDHYVCFVVGSDQVWNPGLFDVSGRQFLNWAHRHQRIALAPSFGISVLPQSAFEDFSIGLRGFENLSVREDAGAEIIYNLTGRESRVLVDPTLALTGDEWRMAARQSARPLGAYLLTYFLGEVSQERAIAIHEFAAINSLRVIHLMDSTDAEVHSAGPAEFIDLLDNARCVFTDSFHGSAFSVLLNTPVTVFEREDQLDSMASRLDTFLGKLNLNHRRYSASQFLYSMTTTDYLSAHQLLKQERLQFLDFLDTELERACAARADTDPA